MILCTHFLAELYSKCVNPGFVYWSGVIGKAGMPLPEAELVLVITLLAVGSALLLLGRCMPVAAACLTLFQVPTAALFENNPYEQLKSVSLVAAILHVTLSEYEMKVKRDKEKGDSPDAAGPVKVALDQQSLLHS
jgi:uncharacterized membrane protein YphA (DoxX/SURF4 family)